MTDNEIINSLIELNANLILTGSRVLKLLKIIDRECHDFDFVYAINNNFEEESLNFNLNLPENFTIVNKIPGEYSGKDIEEGKFLHLIFEISIKWKDEKTIRSKNINICLFLRKIDENDIINICDWKNLFFKESKLSFNLSFEKAECIIFKKIKFKNIFSIEKKKHLIDIERFLHSKYFNEEIFNILPIKNNFIKLLIDYIIYINNIKETLDPLDGMTGNENIDDLAF